MKRWFLSLLIKRFFIIFLIVIEVLVIVVPVLHGSYTSAIVSKSLALISVLVCIRIISKKDKGGYKLIWVFLISLFPVFGGLFYLLFNAQSTPKRFSKKVEKAEKRVKTYMLLPPIASERAIEVFPQSANQIRYLEDHTGFPIYDDSHVVYLSPGERKLEVLLEELQKAEQYIFLEYFIVKEGKMWNSVLEILKKKAAAGVKVRMLYDDMGCFLKLPKDYAKQLRSYGIDCRVFNRFKPLLSTMQNNRDHRKIVSVDGKVAFTSGINLSDEYINVVKDQRHYKDASIMLEGKAAWSLTLMFLEMWEVTTGIEEDYTCYYPWKAESCPHFLNGFVQPYADSPMDEENVGEHVYMQIINNAKKYVYITSPYLIIDDSMTSALCLAAKSGVDVRIATPSESDSWAIHTVTRSYYRELIAAGIKIYEYSKGYLHAKTFVSDDTVATVGTTNLDFRSLYLNFECGVVMYGCTAVKEIREDYLNMLNVCREIAEEDCKCSLWVRTFQDVMRIFAPLI